MNKVTAIGINKFKVEMEGVAFTAMDVTADQLCKIAGVHRAAVRVDGGTIKENEKIVRYELGQLYSRLEGRDQRAFNTRFGDPEHLAGGTLIKAAMLCRNTLRETLPRAI